MLWDASANQLGITETLATNPGAAVIPFSVNITHSAGAGDCNDLVASYSKVSVTGAGDSGLTAVGIAARAYQGTADDNSAADEIYGMQSFAKHMGTGACQAMSAVSGKLIVNATDAFTATNSINAAHFHVEAADGANGTITSSHFDCLMLEVYPHVTGLDSVLKMAVETTETVGAWFDLDGGTDVTSLFNISAASACVITSDPSVGAANTWLKCLVGSTVFYLVGYAEGT
jgi:hypothetical protein